MKTKIAYLVVLLSFLSLGCKKEEEEKPIEKKVSARFEYEQLQYAPCMVYFTNTSQNSYSVVWDLGYGFSTYGSFNIKRWYDKAGSYPVAIRAYSSNGDSSTFSKNITVQ